jgi:hypothetical protein
MRALMVFRGSCLVLLALCGLTLGACGKEIGDACVLSSDCSPNGDRVCLCSYCSGSIDQTADQGYCTVLGCDHSSCPEESACVRFFTGDFDNRVCDPAVAEVDCKPDPTGAVVCCSLDELCAINGHCVPRASEVRYCMRTCSSSGDCRDGYECRDFALMKEHGGQAVLESGMPNAQNSPKFCAAKPP